MSPDRALALGIALLLGILGLHLLRVQPLPARGLETPAEHFSAARAREVLARILGDERPHPVGTPENARVRARIRAELERLGHTVETQAGFACSGWGRCAAVRNLLVHVPGRSSRDLLVLTAHHDSVPAGPGANDAGAAVATLIEVARALGPELPLRNGLLILVTDGEEMGLLGAEAFVNEHPLMEQVQAVVSLEARGGGGPSQMFRTGPGSADLVRSFARVCPRPMGSSAASTLLEQMPNDTDLAVFRRAGKAGLDFAYSDDYPVYHSRHDDLAHLNLDGVQHRGACTLALARALGAAELPGPGADDRLFYQDLMGTFVVRGPTGVVTGLALLGAITLGAALARLRARGALGLGGLAWGVGAQVAGGFLGALTASALVAALRGATGQPAPWTGTPLPFHLALGAGVFGAALLPAIAVRGRAGFWGLWGGAFVPPTLFALWVAVWTPAVALGLAVTAAGAGLAPFLTGAVAHPDAPARRGATALLALLPIAWFQLVLVIVMPSVLGLGNTTPMAVPVAGVAVAFAPLLAAAPRPGWLPGALLVGALAATVVAAVLPPYSEASPQTVNLLFHEDADEGTAHWIVPAWSGPLPEAVARAGGLRPDQPPRLPFASAPEHRGEAEATGAAPPRLDLLEEVALEDGARRRLRLRMRSPRGAPDLSLLLPPGVDVSGLTMNGVPFPTLPPYRVEAANGWRRFQCVGLPPEGVLVELVVPAEPVEAWLLDATFSLPASGRALDEARGRLAVPRHGGDQWWVTRRVRL